MLAHYIIPALAVVFFIAAALKLLRSRGKPDAASRTWLLVAAIFAVVGLWLWNTAQAST